EPHGAVLSGDRQRSADSDRHGHGSGGGTAPGLSGALQMKPVVGIDLGTTNCALAYTDQETVEQFAIPQLVHEGEVREESLLPSFVFLDPAGPIAGVLAQRKGLDNAGRLVTSAKSWLSHSGVD